MPKLSNKYPKIQSIYKRDNDGKFVMGKYSTPEIEYLKDNRWQFTEKVDGMNIRVIYKAWIEQSSLGVIEAGGGQLTTNTIVQFAGRSDNAQLPMTLVEKLDALFKYDKQLQKLHEIFGKEDNTEVVLYGEGYGAGIQSGGNYIQDKDFVLFDVTVNGMFLERYNVDSIAEDLGIKSVPVIGNGTLQDGMDTVKKGFTSTWGKFIAEGIVARPMTEIFTRRGDRIITKIKHRDFQ